MVQKNISDLIFKGGTEAPPPEAEIFRSETYANFIYLFFKIGTEVNVFSHLGKVLFMHMKEAMFTDQDPLQDSEEEQEDGENQASVKSILRPATNLWLELLENRIKSMLNLLIN